MEFMNAIKNSLDNEYNISITENGAVGFRTTGKALLDLNFAVASMRNASEREIISKYEAAYRENKLLALKWLFFVRDIRGGLGERRLFRVIAEHLAQTHPEVIIPVIELISEYGRYDDLWCLLDTPAAENIYRMIDIQLKTDWLNMIAKKPTSLLAKWMPSINASSAKTKAHARKMCKALHMTKGDYRKALSSLRRHLNIVETKMSQREWSAIEYEKVPSRANLIYNNAFLRNDADRRKKYLAALEKGEVNINAGTLFPHDIVHKYCNNCYSVKETNATLEQLWKALPDTVQGCNNTIVVADGSGSMDSSVDPRSGLTALEVANALAIYFAERSSGQFKDKYITFSNHPQYVAFPKRSNLRDKILEAREHCEVANTNIEAVFDLILHTAIANSMRQEDLPQNILIISDMEFDSCVTANGGGRYTAVRPTKKLFEVFAERYAAAGYKLPRLVFWNVCSRTGTIPIKENALGVALVSGFSPNVAKMVMSGKLDPYECLLETLNSERYAPVEKALGTIVGQKSSIDF